MQSLPDPGLELRQGSGLHNHISAPAGADTPKGRDTPLGEVGAEPQHPVRLQGGPIAHAQPEILVERLGRVLDDERQCLVSAQCVGHNCWGL